MPPRPDYRRSRHAFAGTVGAAGDLALTVYGQAMTPERSDQLAVAIESERYLLPWQVSRRKKLFLLLRQALGRPGWPLRGGTGTRPASRIPLRATRGGSWTFTMLATP